MASTFGSALAHVGWAPFRRSMALRPFFSPAGRCETLDVWEERSRFRLKLEDMLKSAPHLIEDIGLTRAQAEAEIAKPLWRC